MITRRHLVLGSAASTLAATMQNMPTARAMGQPPVKDDEKATAKTYVLVHGAWHGGWCWRDVARAIGSAGHRVFTPTLTGMGARHHLARRDTDMNTHIKDVLQVLTYEELSDVILVGHSYGGPVVEGVYDQAADLISKVILLDASMVNPGETMMTHTPPDLIAQTQATLIDGYMLAPWAPEAFGVLDSDGAAHAWLKRRLTSMPYKSLSTPLMLSNDALSGPETLYISCTKPQMQGADRSTAQAQARGFEIKTIAAGHDAMVTAPDTLTTLLLEAA